MPSTIETEQDLRDRAALRVLDTLDRWSERLHGRSTQKRAYPRKPYRSMITVYLPDDRQTAGECSDSVTFQVWGRNLSCAGAGFVYDRQIKSEKIVLCLKTGSKPIWLNADVVRARQVHDGFWEYGVIFRGPAAM